MNVIEEIVASFESDDKKKLEKALAVIKMMKFKLEKALSYWDDGYNAKVGKYIKALSGRLPGYFPELDKLLKELDQ